MRNNNNSFNNSITVLHRNWRKIMKIKCIKRYLDELLRDRKQQLGYVRSPEAKLFLEGQLTLLKQIQKNIKDYSI